MQNVFIWGRDLKGLSEVRKPSTKPFCSHIFIEPCKIKALHLIYIFSRGVWPIGLAWPNHRFTKITTKTVDYDVCGGCWTCGRAGWNQIQHTFFALIKQFSWTNVQWEHGQDESQWACLKHSGCVIEIYFRIRGVAANYDQYWRFFGSCWLSF